MCGPHTARTCSQSQWWKRYRLCKFKILKKDCCTNIDFQFLIWSSKCMQRSHTAIDKLAWQFTSPKPNLWYIKLYDSYSSDIKPQCNMTGNTPPCEVCLMPLKAWQSVSLPPSPLLPQHVLTPNNIREGASWCGHEFEGFTVWKRSWSHSFVLKLRSRLQEVWGLIWPRTCETSYTQKILSR